MDNILECYETSVRALARVQPPAIGVEFVNSTCLQSNFHANRCGQVRAEGDPLARDPMG